MTSPPFHQASNQAPPSPPLATKFGLVTSLSPLSIRTLPTLPTLHCYLPSLSYLSIGFLTYLSQSSFLTQGMVSNIPIVFSWSDSIRPEGFLSSVLLWLVIIVAVVGVGVTVVVVVESSSVVKLSFVIT
ncbi:hypothetical protein Tco_0655594 [Tanacetum coccineum]|uniref:Uncharacterized protein n=1 Tax=Tanacetum coccineum TaxID=301880 RepID=A0ABQ4X6F6_9ASTR